MTSASQQSPTGPGASERTGIVGLWLRLWRVASRRKDIRQAGLTILGAIGAQVVLLASYPIVLRLFTPEDFGILISMMYLATVAASLAGLGFDEILTVPRSARVAEALFQVTLVSIPVISVLVGGLLGLVQWLDPDLFGAATGPGFVIGTTIYMMLFSYSATAHVAHSRGGAFAAIAVNRVTQALFSAVAQIILGVLAVPMGLVIGRLTGLATSLATFLRTLPRGFVRAALGRWDWRAIRAAMRLYRDAMLHVPRIFMLRSGTAMPPVMLTICYDVATAGFFGLSARIIERPGLLMQDAVSRVPLKQFSDRRAERLPLARVALFYTALLGVPILGGVGLLTVFAEDIFTFVFGDQWTAAADYAVMVGIWAGTRMATQPVNMLVQVLRLQRRALPIDSAFYLVRVLAIPAAFFIGLTAPQAVAFYCMTSALYSLLIWTMCMSAAVAHDQNLAAAPARP